MTTTVVDIPGGTATLRDPAELKERHRRLLQTAMIPLAKLFQQLPEGLLEQSSGRGPEAEIARAKAERLMAAAVTTRQEGTAFAEMGDAVIVALLEDWTLDAPLPTMDTILDLEPPVYAALEKAARNLTPAVMKSATPTDFGPNPGGDTPFGESSTSSTASRGGANGSTGKRRNTGGNTRSGATSAA